MERLTSWNEDCVQINGHALAYATKCELVQMAERLAAYEDTGMTPEAVETVKLALVGKHMADIETMNNTPISRLVELAEADKDGRLVVMPCKIGDKLYRVFAGEIFEHRVGTMKYFAIQGRWGIETYPFCPCVESSIGKTVFFTREEAERAMEDGKDD